MRFGTAILATTGLALPVSCTNAPVDESEMLARWDAQHDAALAVFQAEQADLVARTPIPQQREFPGLGTLVLDGLELIGRPGKAFVRARFTFVNSSSAGFEEGRVSLYLRNPLTSESWGEWLLMHAPLAIRSSGGRAGPESTYTSWIETPTQGVEFVPGWSWDLVLEAREEEAPHSDETSDASPDQSSSSSPSSPRSISSTLPSEAISTSTNSPSAFPWTQ
jgi:hypothetical protein